MHIRTSILLFFASILFYSSCKNKDAKVFITDKAKIFNAGQSKFLDSVVKAYESRTSNEIFIYTIGSIQDQDINADEYATNLLKDLHVGKQGLNNGILFFVAINDKKVVLRLAHGLEWLMSGSDRQRIINEMTYSFSQGDYFAGIYTAVSKSMSVIKNISWDFCKENNKDKCVAKARVKEILGNDNNELKILTTGDSTVSLRYTDYMNDLIGLIEKNKNSEVVYRNEAGEAYLLGVLQ